MPSKMIFPLQRAVWRGIPVWYPARRMALHNATKALSSLPPTSLNPSTHPQDLLIGCPSNRVMWNRIGERCYCAGQARVQSQAGATPQLTVCAGPSERFPAFTEEARFVSPSEMRVLLKDIKFFHEAANHSHFDLKYFHGSLSKSELKAEMRAVFVEFSALMDHYGVPYFLDGGSLIGWFWNKACNSIFCPRHMKSERWGWSLKCTLFDLQGFCSPKKTGELYKKLGIQRGESLTGFCSQF